MLTTPAIEKQYEVGLYVNSTKMLNNIIYLKWKKCRKKICIDMYFYMTFVIILLITYLYISILSHHQLLNKV